MDLSFDDMRHLDPALARSALPAFLRAHLDVPEALGRAVESDVARLLMDTDDATLRASLVAFFEAGAEYRFQDADGLCRAMSRVFMGPLLSGSHLRGLDHLRAAADAGPCLLLGNHLSYVDAQVLDTLLADQGAVDLADRLVAVAGPKVYAAPFRRLAAMALGTIKTPQSTSLAHNEAGLTLIEVARIALQTIEQASSLMSEGRLVVLYAEGTRSRTGRLQPFLAGARRYTRGVRHLVPVACTGPELLFPVGARHLHATPVTLKFGRPIPVDGPGAVDTCWRAIADLLPPAYRPE